MNAARVGQRDFLSITARGSFCCKGDDGDGDDDGELQHHLRLRRIRDCEAEEEHEAEQSLFHSNQYGARHLRILSYYDQCLLCRDEFANRAVVPRPSRSLEGFPAYPSSSTRRAELSSDQCAQLARQGASLPALQYR